jgi:DNA-binding transcriptional LysR family regulator
MRFDGKLLSGINVLLAVIEAGSFTRAAESLGLSSSGVSRAISRLEGRLGVRLFDRTTRSLRLTSDGARLYELASPHLAGLEEAAQRTSGAAASVKGGLGVGLHPIFARHIFAPELPRFSAMHPDLELTIVHIPDAGDLIASGIDIAVTFGAQPSSVMSSRLLLQTRVLTVAAPSYLARHGVPQTPSDLIHHECVDFIDEREGKPFGWQFQHGTEQVPAKVRARFTLTDVDAMVKACVAGAGIAQVPALGIEPLIERGALVELFPDMSDETYPLYAIRPSRRLAPAKVEAFWDFCVNICRGYAPSSVLNHAFRASLYWNGVGSNLASLR